MKARTLVLALVAVVIALAAALIIRNRRHEAESVALGDCVYRLDFDVRVLNHLKGCEDPRLKRLLDNDFVFAASEAKHLIDEGAEMGPIAAINLVRSVRDALAYASANNVEEPNRPTWDDKLGTDLLTNLRLIEGWMDRRAEPARREDERSRKELKTR